MVNSIRKSRFFWPAAAHIEGDLSASDYQDIAQNFFGTRCNIYEGMIVMNRARFIPFSRNSEISRKILKISENNGFRRVIFCITGLQEAKIFFM